MRQLIAAAIDYACRRALYVWLGLRIPAARIRHEDLSQLRQHAEDRFLLALGEAEYWNKEIDRLDDEIGRSSRDLCRAFARREQLRIPNPAQPMDSV